MSDRFEFIDAEYAIIKHNQVDGPSVGQMCRWLEVSRSGFYEWRDRPTSATARRRADLALLVEKSFTDSNDTYGYRRVHADLTAWGWKVSPELVRAIMREQGFQPCQPRPWRFNLTDADAQPAPIPDLVRRDFTADAPGVKLVGDITYISTWEGWVYLATVIDCHTKAVIGWAMDDHYQTPLISLAIERAAKNYPLAPQAIFHSDRGSNGGIKRSSQHLDQQGVFHGGVGHGGFGGSGWCSSAVDGGPSVAGADEVTGASGAVACGGAGVLAVDRGRSDNRGSGGWGGCVDAGRQQVVPTRWRDVPDHLDRAHRPVSVVR